MPTSNNNNAPLVVSAFGSETNKSLKPKKTRPYSTYRIISILMLLPPILMVAFYLFLLLVEGSEKTQQQSNTETTITALLMIPIVSLMIIWNFAAIPLFFYSALTLSKAAKPKISISTIILCIVVMSVITTMYIIGISNNGDSELRIIDIFLAPYTLTTNIIFN